MTKILMTMVAVCAAMTMAARGGGNDPGDGGDFGRAQWIGHMTHEQARLPQGRNFTGAKLKEPAVKAAWAAVDTLSARSICLRRQFRLQDAVQQATVCVVGLGFYELTIDGRKVGDSEFAPLWSDYDKTVFYNTYDVTALLSHHEVHTSVGADLKSAPHESGISNSLQQNPQTSNLNRQSTIEVLLGNGFYNEQGRRYAKMKIAFGPPTLLLRLHIVYRNGREEDIVSDGQWQWRPSPVTFNSIYGGEDYDARLESTPEPSQGEGRWQPVVIQQAPRGVLRRQIAQPVKIMERFDVKDTILYIKPASQSPSGPERGGAPDGRGGVLVLDMGQNLAGFPEIMVNGAAGQRLKLTPGETLTKDSLVNQKQTGRPHYYTYILKGAGSGEVWHPRFSYYGYRYLQIEGDIDVLRRVQSCFVYNSARKTGSFECSNALLNDAYRLIDRAIRSNWQSVWTDCPHREKLGWLEQDWLNGEGLLANYDCRSFIEQTMQNISDAQEPSGRLPEIAPNLCVFEGSWAPPFLESPEWGGAFVALPFLYRDYYGDDTLVRRYRQQMKRYVDYLATQDSCYILRQGLGDWYDFGPGRAGFAQNTPMPLVSTAHYYWWNHLLGEPRADSIKAAFIKEFYHADTHLVGTGSQCAQAIALEMHLVPEADRQAVLQHLLADISRHGYRLTTGDVGNRYLFNALVHNGQQEVLYQMLNHYDVPGYGYQIKLGHTTLTEQWNPEHGASMNHFMMGHLNNLLVPYFLGIQRRGDQLTIAPHPVGDLTWCRGALEAAQGEVKVSWRIDEQKDGRPQRTFTLDVDVPPGAKARVVMPYSGHHRRIGAGHHTLTDVPSP